MTQLEALLRTIHSKTAEAMLKVLEKGDEEITPQFLQAVSKFLKDNNIFFEVKPGNPEIPHSDDLPFAKEGLKEVLKRSA